MTRKDGKPPPGNNQSINGDYSDGIYTEEGDRWEYGNENATIIISDKRISGITLRKLDPIGKEVNYEEWTGNNVKGKNHPNLDKYRVDLAKTMVAKQTYDVEVISGATLSSENWKKAVHKALIKAGK